MLECYPGRAWRQVEDDANLLKNWINSASKVLLSIWRNAHGINYKVYGNSLAISVSDIVVRLLLWIHGIRRYRLPQGRGQKKISLVLSWVIKIFIWIEPAEIIQTVHLRGYSRDEYPWKCGHAIFTPKSVSKKPWRRPVLLGNFTDLRHKVNRKDKTFEIHMYAIGATLRPTRKDCQKCSRIGI